MKSKFILFSLAILIPMMGVTQEDLLIGQWRSHLPYITASKVTQSASKVYFATEQALVVHDKDESTFDFLTKVEGLSEVGVDALLYDEVNEQLIVAYTNSVIDIINGSEIFRITDIRDKTSIQGDKRIYDMYIQGGEYLYLAMGFGLVQFDLTSFEFGFTLDISETVTAVDGHGDNLVISLTDEAYTVDLSETNIPAFFDEWTLLKTGLPDMMVPVDVYMEEERIYLASSETLFLSDLSYEFDSIYSDPDSLLDIQFVKHAVGDRYMLGLRHRDEGKGESKVIQFDPADQKYAETSSCASRLIDAVLDEQNRMYIADGWDGFRYKTDFNGDCIVTELNSPAGLGASDISVGDGEVYFASGGVTENFGFLFNSRGIYVLQDDGWSNINRKTSSFMAENDVLLPYTVEADPRTGRVFFGSFWAGLVSFDPESGELKLYNNQNSPLELQVGDDRVKITGLAFDDESNLWISNFSAAHPFAVMTPEGNWFSYEIEEGDDKVEQIVVDDVGLVWIVIGGTNGGLVVHDPAGTPLDPTDDAQRSINLNNSEIESNLVYCLAKDRSGAVWVGTGQGAVVFECGRSAVEDDCEGNRRKVLQDSIVAFLLESEEVLAIEVDGADRKWFGTRNGIFVQSPDGEEQIAQFDSDNSPLFDNTIRALAFEPDDGVMYISTDKGIQSVRTETTGSTRRHKSDVIAFPNPVRPDYNGPIAIKGLATDAEVRITDIAGRLVHKTEALGGQAIWDGHNLHGEKVPGGVYLVFSSSSDVLLDVDSHVTKILVVR